MKRRKKQQAKYLFGDIVVIDKYLIGIILKTWKSLTTGRFNYEVYVRNFNSIKDYTESNVKRYQVRHKELSEEELEWQNQ